MNATARQYLIDCDTMDRLTIAALNRSFAEWLHRDPSESVSESEPGAFEAVTEVASMAGLVLLHSTWDGEREDARLYVSPRGQLVNAWVSGDALGFDDRLASHEDQS